MTGVLSRPLFRQHYQTGGGVSDLLERGRGMGGAALERGRGMGGAAVEYLMKQGLSLEEAIEQIKNNPRLIEALERGRAAIDDPRVRATLERGRGVAGEALERGRAAIDDPRVRATLERGRGMAGEALERGRAAIDDPRVRATLERGRGMAGEALERGRGLMERLHGVPPGGFGAGSVNVPPGGVGAGPVNVPPGGFGGTNLPVPVQRSGLPVPTSSDVGFPRSFDKDHIDSFRNKAGRFARGLGRLAMNPYVAAATIGIPLAYDALTDSPEELLDQLDTQTRAYVEYLMEQGVSIEEALKIASPSEEAPLERQAGGAVTNFNPSGDPAADLSGLAVGGLGLWAHSRYQKRQEQQQALALLPPEQRAQVKVLIDQGVSVEDALEAVAQEEAPLERQAGGPVMSPQAMMPPPQGMPPQAMMAPPQAAPAGMDALIAQAPDMLNRAEGAVANRMEDVGREYVNNTLSAVDRAEDPEELINALRGTDVPLEQRYDELAQIVGEQDAEATPPSVLALVQPAIMMTEQGAVDSGIGNLMQELSSSAEMLTGEGEATPMGEGVGNLMMAGAQPAMEALPPEAMMGPPPGAMMGPPPGAMMGPPPGGMAYGGPVQRFAQGGPVQHFKDGRGVNWGGGLGDRGVRAAFGGVGRAASSIGNVALGALGRNPIVGTALGIGGLGALGWEAYGNPTIQRLFGLGDFETEIPAIAGGESAFSGYTVPDHASIPGLGLQGSAIMPGYTSADLFTAESLPDLGNRAPMFDAAARATKALEGRNITGRIDPSVFDVPTIAPAKLGDTEATVLERPGRMTYEPSQQDFKVDYDDPEGFKKNFDARLKLYEEVLGSDKDFTKSQMLFDIAGAGLNFAGGRGAGGENVATRSPAAQLAAAFSQVPKTMGERLALQRQEQRGVKTAALAATEKEEAARREVVAGERKLKQNLMFDVSKGTFDANNLVNLAEGKMTHERTLQTADRHLRGELARISSSTDLAAVAMSGKINAARDEIGHLYNTMEHAATLETRLKERLLVGNVAITQTNLGLENDRVLAEHRETSAEIRSHRGHKLARALGAGELRNANEALKIARLSGLDRFNLGLEGAKTERARAQLTLEIEQNKVYADSYQFDRVQNFRETLSGRDQRMFDKKLAMTYLMTTTGQLTREDLLIQAGLDRELQSAMGIDDWNKFRYQLDESVRQFDTEHGLSADSIYGTLALKNRVFDLEAYEYLQGRTKSVFDVAGGTQAERDRNIFAMRPLWKRYAEGTLAPAQEDYLSALITGYLDPALNAQGLETRKALPQMQLAALREREKRGLTMPIQSSTDVDFSGVDPDFFSLDKDAKDAALDSYDNRFSNLLPGR
jgi:hypothetical protein